MLSCAVQIGYYFSAFTVDKHWMGRVRLQSMGFCMVFILFLCCAAAYDQLVKYALHWFQVSIPITKCCRSWLLLPMHVLPTLHLRESSLVLTASSCTAASAECQQHTLSEF